MSPNTKLLLTTVIFPRDTVEFVVWGLTNIRSSFFHRIVTNESPGSETEQFTVTFEPTVTLALSGSSVMFGRGLSYACNCPAARDLRPRPANSRGYAQTPRTLGKFRVFTVSKKSLMSVSQITEEELRRRFWRRPIRSRKTCGSTMEMSFRERSNSCRCRSPLNALVESWKNTVALSQSINQSIMPSTGEIQPINQSINQSIKQTIKQYINRKINQSINRTMYQ